MKNYKGSCHCQAVQFDVILDFSKGIHKCNCTFCFKTKYLKMFTKEANLKITKGESELKDYVAQPSNWPPGHIHHYHCRNCGVQVFSKGFLEMDKEPFNGWFWAVNGATLDNLDPMEIINAPVIFEDGLHDKQLEPPRETRHL